MALPGKAEAREGGQQRDCSKSREFEWQLQGAHEFNASCISLRAWQTSYRTRTLVHPVASPSTIREPHLLRVPQYPYAKHEIIMQRRAIAEQNDAPAHFQVPLNQLRAV